MPSDRSETYILASSAWVFTTPATVRFVILRRTVVSLVGLVALAGCTAGSGSNAAPGNRSDIRPAVSGSADPDTATQVVELRADDSLRFSPALLRVEPGRVRLVFINSGRLPQNFTSLRLNANSGNVPAGQRTTLDLMVPAPGKYPFYNAYHKTQGMTGKIVAAR